MIFDQLIKPALTNDDFWAPDRILHCTKDYSSIDNIMEQSLPRCNHTKLYTKLINDSNVWQSEAFAKLASEFIQDYIGNHKTPVRLILSTIKLEHLIASDNGQRYIFTKKSTN